MASPYREYLDAKSQRQELTVGPFSDQKKGSVTPIDKKTPQQKQEKSLEARGRIQAAMERALMACARGEVPLPPEMAADLAFAMRDVVGGVANELFTPIAGGTGGGGRTPNEKSCIEDAVRYRRAVGKGWINDRHPIITILDAFGGDNPMSGGVSRRTVQSWMREEEFKAIKATKSIVNNLFGFLNFSGRHYQQNYTKKARSEG
jgi:hypothetical protein